MVAVVHLTYGKSPRYPGATGTRWDSDLVTVFSFRDGCEVMLAQFPRKYVAYIEWDNERVVDYSGKDTSRVTVNGTAPLPGGVLTVEYDGLEGDWVRKYAYDAEVKKLREEISARDYVIERLNNDLRIWKEESERLLKKIQRKRDAVTAALNA